MQKFSTVLTLLQPVTIGITSLATVRSLPNGKKRCLKKPAVFTSVLDFVEWIWQILEKDEQYMSYGTHDSPQYSPSNGNNYQQRPIFKGIDALTPGQESGFESGPASVPNHDIYQGQTWPENGVGRVDNLPYQTHTSYWPEGGEEQLSKSPNQNYDQTLLENGGGHVDNLPYQTDASYWPVAEEEQLLTNYPDQNYDRSWPENGAGQLVNHPNKYHGNSWPQNGVGPLISSLKQNHGHSWPENGVGQVPNRPNKNHPSSWPLSQFEPLGQVIPKLLRHFFNM